MSKVVHQVIVTLTFDKAAPPKQAAALMRRLLTGAPLEQAIFEESMKHGNNAAPVLFAVHTLATGLLAPVAETTDPWDGDDAADPNEEQAEVAA